MRNKIEVEVAYALTDKQYVKRVILENGSTVEQAIIASAILELQNNINLYKNKIGIYSQPVKLSSRVKNGDRIEIYRPLIANPKQLLQQRRNKIIQK